MNNIYYADFKRNSIPYLLLFLKPGKQKKQVNDLKKFNLNGKIKRYEKIITKPDSIIECREIFFFNEEGYLIEENRLEGKKIIKTILKYYDENKISSSEAFNEKGEQIRSTYYKYNKKGILFSKNHYEKHINSSFKAYYYYDLRNNIIKEEVYLNDTFIVNLYDYNFDGELINTYSYEDNIMCRHIKTSKHLINNRNIIESYVLMNDGGIFSKQTDYYNSNMDIIAETRYIFNNPQETETTYIFQYPFKGFNSNSKNDENWTKKQKFYSSLVETIITKIEYFD